tara:strand:- start:41 stop:265 length:225 start_codon:yes stop_codon:yes gene_type:complete
MNLLQAEFKSLKVQAPGDEKDYILTDGDYFAVACLYRGRWLVSNAEAPTDNGFVNIELDFKPTHFAEIKTGEIK